MVYNAELSKHMIYRHILSSWGINLINLWYLWVFYEYTASWLAYIQKELENISWEIYFLGKWLTNI